MTITIRERVPHIEKHLAFVGFEMSVLAVDEIVIGTAVYPVNQLDYGMLEADTCGKLRPPTVGGLGVPRIYVRFGRKDPKAVDGIEGIVTAIKDELNDDYRAVEIAEMLLAKGAEFQEGYLTALENPDVETDCSATALRVTLLKLQGY